MKFFFTSIWLVFSFCVFAQDNGIPSKPNPPRLVNDYTNTLTPAQVQALESKLVGFDDTTSSQIAVVIVSSLNGDEIANYAMELGDRR
jgi:uncharacterized protein